MKREVFYKLYEHIIKPSADNLLALGQFEFIGNVESLYCSYQEQKTYYRFLCNKNVYNEMNRSDLLDRHKVCACLLAAINNVNLLGCVGKEDEPNDIQALNKINVQLSILVSLKLLGLFIICDENIDNDYKKYFMMNMKYRFPEVSSNEEAYEDCLIRSIAISKYTNHLDLPLIAHILFLLEKYHVIKCQKEELQLLLDQNTDSI